MSLASWLILVCAAVWVGLLVALERRRRALQRAPAPPPALPRYPSLTVIHPIRGLDPGARRNIDAALNIAYPGELESIFVFDDDQEPALPLVRAAIAEHEELGRPGTARVLIAGPPPPGFTGKLAAMNAGVRVAKGRLVAFADSDIRVDRDIVRVLVDLLLATPKAGATFAPVVVSEPPETPGDVGYELMLNSLYSPEIAVWDKQGKELPFIMGQLMVFRREALDAIGGVDCARGQLVDDMHLGARVVAAGLRNIMSSQPIRIVEWGMSIQEFARCARRWLMFSRSGIPARFAVGPAALFLAFWLGLAAFAQAIQLGSAPAAVVGFGLMLTACAALILLNRYVGGPRIPARWWWMSPALLLSGPFVYFTTWVWPEVRWRGRTYGLNVKAELDTAPAPVVGRIRRLLHAEGPGGA